MLTRTVAVTNLNVVASLSLVLSILGCSGAVTRHAAEKVQTSNAAARTGNDTGDALQGDQGTNLGNPDPTPTETPVAEEPKGDEIVDNSEEVMSGKGDPSQSNDGKTPNPGICAWFNPAQPDYAEEIPGAPDGLAVPIKNYWAVGNWEGDHFVFPLVVYHNGNEPTAGNQSLTKDGFRNNSKYTVVITNGKSAACAAVATKNEAGGRNHSGCFAMTTRIKMADGSERVIAHLQKGDLVFNPITKKAASIVEIVEGPETDKPMITLGYSGKRLTVTTDHPFATEIGLRSAAELSLGSKILTADGSYQAVDSYVVQAINASQVVRNIVLDGMSGDNLQHMVMADGIVTGDLYLQRQLAAQRQEILAAAAN